MKKYILMAVAGLALSSCGDFLEPDSTSEFVPKDVNSFNELLLGEAYPRNDVGGLNIFMNMLDDDITAAPYQTPQVGFNADKYLGSYAWHPTMYEVMAQANYFHSDMYQNYYKLILGCNAVLDYVDEDDVIGTAEMRNMVKAQAYTLRAFYYLTLVNIYGQPYNVNPDALGVPLKLVSGIEEDENALKRKPVKDVYAQVVKDLTTAESLYLTLPEEKQWEKNFRTSLPMAQLLLSRAYLYMENWDKAAEYAKKVMDNRSFKLVDLNSVPAQKENEEHIMVNAYTNYHAYTCSEAIWIYGSVSDMVGFTNDYPTANESGEKMHSFFQASKELMDTFEENDLRADRYIVHIDYGQVNDEGEKVLMPQAYGKVNVGENTYRPAGGPGIFGRSLRLSEAYLNYAEAKAMAGAANEAMNVLNQLRKFRFAPENYNQQNFAGDELIKFVRDERRRELCYEGLRWNDLRRWGRKEFKHVWYIAKDTKVTYTLTDNDLLFTVPISGDAAGMNGQLVQNELPKYEKRTGVTENIAK